MFACSLRGPLLPCLLLSWAGCAPIEVAPRFERTAALCGFEPEPIDPERYVAQPSYPSYACVDAVLDDFAVDRDRLLGADGLSDPYDAVRGRPTLHTATGTLLAAARALHTADLGRLWELPEDDALAAALSEVSDATGDDRVAALAYDYVAARVTRTSTGHVGDDDARMHTSGTLTWSLREATPFGAAALLVHEARHRDGWRHVACDDGQLDCDPEPGGPNTFQGRIHEQIASVATDAALAAYSLDRAAELGARVR